MSQQIANYSLQWDNNSISHLKGWMMYKPSLIENLGRYIPNPPRHSPRILPNENLVALIYKKNGVIVAINVTNFFDYDMYMSDFIKGHHNDLELYALDSFVLARCKAEDHPS
jgi:hypothetical protein